MTERVHCFTSFTFSYLSRARVLARTLKQHNPNWHLTALIADVEPEGFEFDTGEEDFDEVLFVEDLDLSDLEGWLFRHDVVEVCTAIKGACLTHLLDQGAEKVVYLDPDIAVFDSLASIEKLLDDHEILLTPHQLAPDDRTSAIRDNEICSLKHGTFNLGFLAVRNGEQGRACAAWWRDRLLEFCYEDVPNGLFTDQRWCDLIPSFFEKVHIIRDPGFNVASWNLSQRKVCIDGNGDILVNDSKLKFFHFTKLGPTGKAMTKRYARDMLGVYELWSWYEHTVEELESDEVPERWWHYGTYDNGQPISRQARLLYRNRLDLQEAFPNPFETGEGSFHEWMALNEPASR